MKFNKTPICEQCEDEEATSLSYIDERWKFCGSCTIETEQYHIQFPRFFKDHTTVVGWMGHMMEKNWFDPKDFCKMMKRLRDATESSTG